MARRKLDPPGASKGAITFGEIAETFAMLTVQCDNCGRHGRYSTAKLVVKYGAASTVQPLQDLLLLPRNQPRKRED